MLCSFVGGGGGPGDSGTSAGNISAGQSYFRPRGFDIDKRTDNIDILA